MNIASYREQLEAVSSFLKSVNEVRWSSRLDNWVQELALVSDEGSIATHVTRTRKAVGGMGSLGDIYITHKNGLAKRFREDQLKELNKEYLALISALYAATNQILDASKKGAGPFLHRYL